MKARLLAVAAVALVVAGFGPARIAAADPTPAPTIPGPTSLCQFITNCVEPTPTAPATTASSTAPTTRPTGAPAATPSGPASPSAAPTVPATTAPVPARPSLSLPTPTDPAATSDPADPRPAAGDKADDTRSESVLLGGHRTGMLNVDDYKLGYATAGTSPLSGLVKIASPLGAITGVTDFATVDPTVAAQGAMAEIGWTFYKYTIDGMLTIVGIVGFSMLLVRYLFDSMLNLGQQWDSKLVQPFGLEHFPLIACAVYLVWAWFLKRRYSLGGAEYFATVAILALPVVYIVPNGLRFLINLTSGLSSLVLITATGGDPSVIPGITGDYLQVDQIYAGYDVFQNGMETTLIRNVHQMVLFGNVLPDACQAPYDKIIGSGLSATDPQFYAPLAGVKACAQYAEMAAVADATRLVLASVLFLWSLIFGVILLWLALPALKGQTRVLAFAATYKFAFLAAALPGTARNIGLVWIFRSMVALFQIIIMSVCFALLFAANAIVLAAPIPGGLIVRLLVMTAFDAFLAVKIGMGRSSVKATVNQQERALRGRRADGTSATPFVAQGHSRMLEHHAPHAQRYIAARALAGAKGGILTQATKVRDWQSSVGATAQRWIRSAAEAPRNEIERANARLNPAPRPRVVVPGDKPAAPAVLWLPTRSTSGATTWERTPTATATASPAVATPAPRPAAAKTTAPATSTRRTPTRRSKAPAPKQVPVTTTPGPSQTPASRWAAQGRRVAEAQAARQAEARRSMPKTTAPTPPRPRTTAREQALAAAAKTPQK